MGWVQVMGTGLRGGFVRKETRLEPDLLPFLIWRRKVVMAHGYPWIRCHKTNISHGFEDKEAVVDGHWCHGTSLPSGTNEGWWWWLVWVCWVLLFSIFWVIWQPTVVDSKPVGVGGCWWRWPSPLGGTAKVVGVVDELWWWLVGTVFLFFLFWFILGN